MSHCSALEREVKSELVLTVKVSVKATHGNVDVASFQLESNTGTFQLPVQASLDAAVPKSHGCTAVAHALAQALRVDNDTPPSLISLPVTPSKTATSQSVALAGQTTSHPPHCQSAPSEI